MDTPLGKLYRARFRVYRQLAKLEPQVASYRARLADLEARIQAMDGQLWIEPPRRHVNPYFKPGELPRIAMTLLKEAGGPVSVSYLAVQALAKKGCLYPGPGIRKKTRIRISHNLTAWSKRGLVVKLGRWKETRHCLAER
jgi:hypothetical protein